MDVRQKGKFGENLTVKYLQRNNINVIATNYHSRYGEVDVIAKDGRFILFIEVKLRKKDSLVSPAESVIKSKQKKIIKTAHDYLLKNSVDLQPRFDIAEIEISENNKINFSYIKNAFWQDGPYSVF